MSCVVKGPVATSAGGSSSTQEEDHMKMITLSLPVSDVFPGPGTPVVCQGLSAERSHLNGKIGDTRGFNEGKFEVHFEEAGTRFEPAIIRHENLGIVFDLS